MQLKYRLLLAERLGMTLARLEAEMPEDELLYWMALDEERAEARKKKG